MVVKSTVRCVIVVLNWNGWRDTVECLDSLLPTLNSDAAVVICDNGSTDGSIERIQEFVQGRFPEWGPDTLDLVDVMRGAVPVGRRMFIVENRANLGFAAGNNSGVRFAMNAPECRYVWLLNNDTTVQPGALSASIAHMETDYSIGICGSTLLYFHEPEVVQALAGAVYSRCSGRSRHIGAFTARTDVPGDPTEVEAQMSYVVGAAMLVSRAFIEQVGYMREDYFLYCEEIDWASRGKRRFRLGYAPESVVLHKEGASIGTSASGGSPLSLFFLFRNRVRYAWRFNRLFVPSVLIFCGVDIARLLVRQRWWQALAALRGVLQLAGPRIPGRPS